MGDCSTTYRSSYSFNFSNQSSGGASYGRRFSDLASSTTPSFRKSSESSDYRGSNASLNSGFRGSNVSLNSGFRGSRTSLNSGVRGSNFSLNSGFKGSNVSLNSGFKGSNASLNSYYGSNSFLNSAGRSRRSSLCISDHKRYGNSTPDIKRGWGFGGKDRHNQVLNGSNISLNSDSGSNTSLNPEGRSRRNSLCVPDYRHYGNAGTAVHYKSGLLAKDFKKSQDQLYTQRRNTSRIPILHRSHGNLLHPNIDMHGSRDSLRSDINGSSESLNFNIKKKCENLSANNRRSRFHQSTMHMKNHYESTPNICKYDIGRSRLDSDMTRSNDSLYNDVHEVHSPINKRKVLTKQNSVSQTIADVLINQSEQKYLGANKMRKKLRDMHNIRVQSGANETENSNDLDQNWSKEVEKCLVPYSLQRAKSHSDILEVRTDPLLGKEEIKSRREKELRDCKQQKIKYKTANKVTTDNDRIRKKVQADLERKRIELYSGENKSNKLKVVGNAIKVCKIPRLDQSKFGSDTINGNNICTVRLNAKNIRRNEYERSSDNRYSMNPKSKNNVVAAVKQNKFSQKMHEEKVRKESKSSADSIRHSTSYLKSSVVRDQPKSYFTQTTLTRDKTTEHDYKGIITQSNSIISFKSEKSILDERSMNLKYPHDSRVPYGNEINENNYHFLAEDVKMGSADKFNNNSTSKPIESFNTLRLFEEPSENVINSVSDNECVNSEGKDESSVTGSVESGIYSHDDDDDKSTASSVDSTISEETNDKLMNDKNHEEKDADECIKELIEKKYEVDSFSKIPEIYNADELILLSDSGDVFDNYDDISFKDFIISENDANNSPLETINNDYFNNCNYVDDLESLPHPGMPGSIDLADEIIKDPESITIAADLINIIDESINSGHEKEPHASKLDSNTYSFSSGSLQDEDSNNSTPCSEKFHHSDCAIQANESIPRPHVIKCSKNIKLFLRKQPCMHDSSSSGRYSPVTEECFHKHEVIESIASEKSEDDLSIYKEPIRDTPPSRKQKHSRKSKSMGKRKLEKADSKQLTKDLNLKDENPSFIMKIFKNMFCTTPVTVEGVLPGQDDGEPEPLPPPIPPHGLEPGRLPPSYESITKGTSRESLLSSSTESETTSRPTVPTTPPAPEPMTHDEAQRLLSAKGGLLSDAEAHEVAMLLSPGAQDTPPTSLHNSAPPPVPPHYADVGPPPVGPRHYGGPVEDEYDSREASHFDPTLASPLSPEDAPSTPDSEISGDVLHVARVKEVLQEDGIHYLEDGHFWVEVPGLPEHDEDDEFEPDLPYHAHTKLSFSKHPMQMFSTYSVSEYDRKNEDVDPVAASAEYELEKRVEKMDIFPVDIVKGDGGLGLSIIGMGVGADAGVEKLGIFVKTITPQGATEKDDRIQVNDQIIEVDGKSLVGVTQVFAASVLKNTSGRVHFLIGREKDPENSEVALLIKQSLQADLEREERRRALGGPEYDPRIGAGLFDPLSSPSEENSRSEEASVQHNYASYMDAGGSSPTSPDAMSPPPEVFDCQGDTDDTSPDNDPSQLRLKLKEGQYKNAMAEAEITKLKMKLVEVESHLLDQRENTAELVELRAKVRDAEDRLHAKVAEASTYQDMLEQSQGQFIVLEKKYYKAKKIIKEYQGRERDFLHREEYHITQLEDKDSHYNALVKALKDRVCIATFENDF